MVVWAPSAIPAQARPWPAMLLPSEGPSSSPALCLVAVAASVGRSVPLTQPFRLYNALQDVSTLRGQAMAEIFQVGLSVCGTAEQAHKR